MRKKGLCRSEQTALKRMWQDRISITQASNAMKVEPQCVERFYESFADPTISQRKRAESERKSAEHILKKNQMKADRAVQETADAEARLSTATAKAAETKPAAKPEIPTPAPLVDGDPVVGTPAWEALKPHEKAVITRRRNQEAILK